MSAPGLSWNERSAFRAWLRDVDTAVTDLVEVAEDQIDDPSKRVHGREGARRLIRDAKRSLRDQLAYARAGLTADEARVRVTLHPEVLDGRRRVVLTEASGAHVVAYVLPEDLDGDRLRVVVASDPDGDPVAVILPDAQSGGTRAEVHRGDVLPVEGAK